jgi:L-fuculose-phosphate aldolase
METKKDVKNNIFPKNNNIHAKTGPQRSEIASIMRRLYRQGLTTTSGGNISMRDSTGTVFITASKSDKGTLREDQVAVLTLSGENLTPGLCPSIETEMHLEIYRRYSGVNAIVHAHPPIVSSFCATSSTINCRLIAESYAIIGEPVRAPYALMGTAALADNVATAAGCGACVLLDNHGALATGKTLLEAFDRMEVLEAAARLTLLTSRIGHVNELSAEQLSAIDLLLGRKRND